MTMRDTSWSALKELEESGKGQIQRGKILRYVLNSSGPVSRMQISRALNIPINAVTGRVNPMIFDKNHNLRPDRILDETDYLIICPITGKRVHGVIPVEDQVQGDLWQAA